MMGAFVNTMILFQLFSCVFTQPSTYLSLAQIENKDSIQVIPELNRYFKEYGVNGSIALYDNSTGIIITNDSVDIRRMNYPASTFKILNLLIALETGAISDINEIIKWQGNIPDTSRYGLRPSIHHDMSVKEAFAVSAGWAFADLAKRIGKAQYQYYLDACNYGNGAYSSEDLDFWNFGPLQISPINQVQFLKRVYDGNVHFSQNNIDILKSLMVTEMTADYIIHSKTGWSKQDNLELGWWTGYFETGNKVYFFSTRITQPFDNSSSFDSKFGKSRKEITFKIFKDLRII